MTKKEAREALALLRLTKGTFIPFEDRTAHEIVVVMLLAHKRYLEFRATEWGIKDLSTDGYHRKRTIETNPAGYYFTPKAYALLEEKPRVSVRKVR